MLCACGRVWVCSGSPGFGLSGGASLSSVVWSREDGLSGCGWSGAVLVDGGDFPSVAVSVGDAGLSGSARGDGVSVDLRVREGDGEGVCGETDGEVNGVAVCGGRGEGTVGGGVLLAVDAVFGDGGAGVESGGAPEKGEGFGGEVGSDGSGDDGGGGGGGLCEGVGGQGEEAEEEESQGWDWGFHFGGIIHDFGGGVMPALRRRSRIFSFRWCGMKIPR